jgi:hypothetical protein
VLDRLAAGDHTADGRMLQAPGKRPRRHRHPRGYLGATDLVHQFELALDLGRVLPGAPVVAGGDPGARLVLAAQVSIGQRLPDNDPKS